MFEYYGQCLDRKPQFQETVKQISKLERSTMTSLLSSFLSYGEEENSEKSFKLFSNLLLVSTNMKLI